MIGSGRNGLKILKFLLVETGTYNEQYRRPYNTNLEGHVLNSIVERISDSKTYNPMMMGGVANQFISPTATPEKQIAMINGWGERRMRFMMEIEYDYYVGGRIKEVVCGYTSHNGVGFNGSIDPNMEFYVNSTVHIRSNMAMTPLGNQTLNTVADSSHIIVDNNWKGILSPVRDQRMRPEDVFSTMSRTQLMGIDTGTMGDSRTVITNTAVKSRRSNASAANYMSQILNGYTQAMTAAEFGDDGSSVQGKARTLTRENIATKDPFLSAIANTRGMAVGNTFTFGDLKMIDPNIEYVTKAHILAPTEKATVHQHGQTADWGSTDYTTSKANMVSQAIPGLLMDLALMRVVFKSTNRTIGGQIVTTIIDADGFSSGDISKQLEAFIIRLEHEIVRDITFDNNIDFALEMRVDLLGETWLTISLDGQPAVDYVTPSFADAMLTPIITNDDQRALNLANDFEILTSQLADTGYNTSSSNAFGGWSPTGI